MPRHEHGGTTFWDITASQLATNQAAATTYIAKHATALLGPLEPHRLSPAIGE